MITDSDLCTIPKYLSHKKYLKICVQSLSSSFILKTSELGSDVGPRVDSQTTGDTLQDLTPPISGKNCQQPVIHPWMLLQDFGGGMPFHANQFRLGKRHWNLETSSVVIEFPPCLPTLSSCTIISHT